MTQTAPAPQITANMPARHRKAIIFCCDMGYLPYAALAIEQIATRHPDRDFDICICFNERAVTLPDSLAHLQVRLIKVSYGDLFEGLRLDQGKSADVYLRLALPDALAEDYDRILYLDADILVQGGDFSALLDSDLGGHAIGAVRDNIQWRTPNRTPPQFKLLGLPTAPYFNSGLLLIDPAKYRAKDLLNACISLGRAETARMIRHDQNLLNAALQGDWAELSPLWNWQYSFSARFYADVQGPHILHFIGQKPWNDVRGEYPPRIRDSYTRFIAAHFPDHPAPAHPARQIAPDSRRMVQMLLKHLMSCRKMGRYLAKFPTDLTVLR
ncbi:glycosyltransferase family 8 protein [Rhodobacteraceae bacterium]|nr:glycosyltransferase family 8 protein [Paracoccaceae bacterium]